MRDFGSVDESLNQFPMNILIVQYYVVFYTILFYIALTLCAIPLLISVEIYHKFFSKS